MRLATMASVLALVGCMPTEPRGCFPTVDPAIIVEVRDAVSNALIADQARGIVRDRWYTDSLRVHAWLGDGTVVSLAGADGRPGVYDVVIERAGYAQWTASAVLASSNRCTVVTTVRLLARLRAAP